MTAIDRLNKPEHASDKTLSKHAERHRSSRKRVRVNSAGTETAAPRHEAAPATENHTQLLAVASFLTLLAQPLSWLKLQDLLYYAQGWHLVWDGEALFSETILAEADGVRIEPLQARFAGRFDLRASEPLLQVPTQLPENQQQTLSGIVQFYGKMNHFRLSQAIKLEQPWLLARAREAGDIHDEDLAAYFDSLE